jgi:anaerobic selenocysteine-containing dehydrogenase
MADRVRAAGACPDAVWSQRWGAGEGVSRRGDALGHRSGCVEPLDWHTTRGERRPDTWDLSAEAGKALGEDAWRIATADCELPAALGATLGS